MLTGPGSRPPLKWYHRPPAVLLLLFVVLGPLGLPYLWRSPSFSHRMKIVLTVLVVAYTALLVDEMLRAMRAVSTGMSVAGTGVAF